MDAINKNQNLEEDMAQSKGISFIEITENILADFPLRSREIVKKRFGISQSRLETLEKIGKEYGITRERVRQIIADVIKKISRKKDNLNFKKAEDHIIFTINDNFGIIEKSELLDKLAKGNQKEFNAAVFLHTCSDKVFEIKDNKIKEVWTTDKENIKKTREIRDLAEKVLIEEKKLLEDEKISKKILQIIQKDFSEDEILSHLKAVDGIKRNEFGKWGMLDWIEIDPKGTKEKIYTILKEKNKPLHFTEIAEIIDKYKLGKRKAHPQTIHNELIKNEKFVLIGRGIYALREWGFKDGTVRDVLLEIFNKSGKPISRKEILREVLKTRKVKEATVMINLSNRQYFTRENDLYFINKNLIAGASL